MKSSRRMIVLDGSEDCGAIRSFPTRDRFHIFLVLRHREAKMGAITQSTAASEAFDHARIRAQQSGLSMTNEASDELGELVLSSLRKMQESRVLDLQSDAPERREMEQLAKANLMTLVDGWVRIERERGSNALTIGGFRRAYATVCPVYPCA